MLLKAVYFDQLPTWVSKKGINGIDLVWFFGTLPLQLLLSKGFIFILQFFKLHEFKLSHEAFYVDVRVAKQANCRLKLVLLQFLFGVVLSLVGAYVLLNYSIMYVSVSHFFRSNDNKALVIVAPSHTDQECPDKLSYSCLMLFLANLIKNKISQACYFSSSCHSKWFQVHTKLQREI